MFKDNFVLKYLRDFILLALVATIPMKKSCVNRTNFVWICFIVVTALTIIKSDNVGLSIQSLRRYIFPVLMLWISEFSIVFNRDRFQRFIKFIVEFVAVISAWGIFQAWILGDSFLKGLGYAVSYKYGYGREMLNYSFYFGGLGIQRVVSTFSNSNVCALVFGIALIVGLFFYPYIEIKYKNWLLVLIGIGYLLTFSRSNFLSIVIVLLFVMYPYIPHKKKVFGVAALGLVSLLIMWLIQSENGLVYKIGTWIISSVNMTDSSVAGRPLIWLRGLNAVIHNPMGIGYGHVGALATSAGVNEVYSCENSYLAIALDLGLIGLLLFICGLLLTFNTFNGATNETFERRINKCAKSLILYMSVVFFFSNHIYDMEAVSIGWFCIGIMINLKRTGNWKKFLPKKQV